MNESSKSLNACICLLVLGRLSTFNNRDERSSVLLIIAIIAVIAMNDAMRGVFFNKKMHYFSFFLQKKKFKRSIVNLPTADYGVVFIFREGHM